MSLFGRQDDTRGPRTAADRERARAERAARRAARGGGPEAAPAPPPPDPVDTTSGPPPEPVDTAPAPDPPLHLDEPTWEDPPAAAEDPPDLAAPHADEPPLAPDPPPIDPRAEEPRPAGGVAPVEEPRAEEPRGADPQPTQAFAPGDAPVPVPDEPRSSADSAPVEPRPPKTEAPEPRAPDPQPTQAFAPGDAPVPDEPEDEEPRVRRVGAPARVGAAPAGAQPPPERRIPPLPERVARYGDAEERPLGVRRVQGSARRDGSATAPPPGAPGAKRPRGRKRFVALALVAVLLAGVLYVANAVFQPLAGDGGEPVTVRIPSGATAGDIGDVLERANVVDSSMIFSIRARLSGQRNRLKAGTYRLRADSKYATVLDRLTEGPPAPKTVNVTVPEGPSRREAAPLIDQAGLRGSYLRASQRAEGFDPRDYGAPRRGNLEGFLFPATFELKPRATADDLVDKQVEAFRENFGKVSFAAARRRNLSRYDVLIIASMVEREAQLARERRLVAAVIHNRLREGMPLGIDATIRYGVNNWKRPLRVSELQSDTPYNTRTRTGLPPTPIGNPGLASIKAAANPANVPYLFYVVKPCGKGAHNFSASDTEFERDRQAYERKREALGGKSPTTC